MTILSENKIQAFRDRLYCRDMPDIMRQGAQGLLPVKKYPEDERGYPLVPIKRITRFFLEEMGKAKFVLPDQYLAELQILFERLLEDLPKITFDPGVSVPQEDIQDAANKTTIELLTTNVIITYFYQAKANLESEDDDTLPEPDIPSIIKQSTAGRDYKHLVSNTLKGLIFSLAQDKPWFEYIDDINDADLICRLAGARLPSMEKSALSSITGKAQEEISGYNDIFTKLLYTRAQTVSSRKNKKEYFKSMEKLDTAIYRLLQKIDHFFGMAFRLQQILELPCRAIIGDTFSKLRQNLLWLFFEQWPKELEQAEMPHQTAVSALRFRMNVLFSVPHVTSFCREVTRDYAFQAPVNELFQLMYKELAGKINRISLDTGKGNRTLGRVERALFETRRAMALLDLDDTRLGDEKEEVKIAYIALVLKTDFEDLSAVLDLFDMICEVTHDRDREIMLNIRSALMEKSFLTLEEYAATKVPPKDAIPEISRRLRAFAVYWRPQRQFYKVFLDTYLLSQPRPRTLHFTQLLMRNRYFAQGMLMLFSDPKAMKELLPDSYIDKAHQMLTDLLEKTKASV